MSLGLGVVLAAYGLNYARTAAPEPAGELDDCAAVIVDDAIDAVSRTLPATEAAAVRRDLLEAASADREFAAEKARAWLDRR